jgi:hypothetical protein
MFQKLTSLKFAGLALLVAATLFLAACAPAAPAPTEELAPTEEPAPPVDLPGTGGTPSPENWQPVPEDENLIRAEVEVQSAEILTLESFPPQYQLHVTGGKGNPCNMLRVAVGEPDENGRIDVDVYTVLDPAATCIQILEGFDINIPLGSLEAGEYSVWLNGQQVGEIVAP